MENKKQLIDQLRSNEIFCHFADEQLEELARMAIRRSLKKGEILALQGSEWRAVLIIESGLLRSVIQSPDGRRLVVTTWQPGSDFWSHTTFDGEALLASLEAVKTSIVFQWQGDVVMDLVLHNQAATRALLARQTRLIRQRRQNIFDLAFNQVTSRLAKLIVDQFGGSENQTVQRDITLEDMAAMAATSPEVVCRTLSKFQTEGYLIMTRASITLQNRGALEDLIGKAT